MKNNGRKNIDLTLFLTADLYIGWLISLATISLSQLFDMKNLFFLAKYKAENDAWRNFLIKFPVNFQCTDVIFDHKV